MTTNERIRGALALIQRSPDIGDGWRNCTKMCWPIIEGIPAELAEREPYDEGGGVVRMTDTGRAVLKYSGR